MDDILRLIYPRQTTQHTYVEEVLGPDAFVIRKGRRFYELRLCSIRLPADSEHADPIASALSNVLLLERVTAEYCCLDENRQPRGVITKIKSDPLLPHPVNRLLVDCGFAFLEPKCRNNATTFCRGRRVLLGEHETASCGPLKSVETDSSNTCSESSPKLGPKLGFVEISRATRADRRGNRRDPQGITPPKQSDSLPKKSLEKTISKLSPEEES